MMTDEQQAVYDTAISGQSLFLTGNAGTGKSYVLNQIIKHFDSIKESVYVTAPTGIAAVNIHGVTLHSLLRVMPSTNLLDGIDNYHKSVAKQIFTPKHAILIIDEISMCRIDLFNLLMQMVNYAENYYGFRMQLILVGDFSQLPPVYKKAEQGLVQKKFDGLFAFDSKYWKFDRFKPFILKRVIRQNNPEFIKVLNQIRVGDTQGVSYLNDNSASKIQTNAITITGTNAAASQINNSHLSSLMGPLFTFNSDTLDEFTKSAQPTDTQLSLKIGARVMVIVNANGAYNGEMGTVEKVMINHRSYGIGSYHVERSNRYRKALAKAQSVYQKIKISLFCLK